MLTLFFVVWGLLFGAARFAIAATPTTVVTPTSSLLSPLLWTGGIAAVVTLVVAGFLSIDTARRTVITSHSERRRCCRSRSRLVGRFAFFCSLAATI